jgi:hypothetical protein
MPFFGRAIESITQQDLQRLIDDEITEGKSIDYKLELNLEKGDDKKEFLADVTSFANTAGGHLLIGIKPDGDRAIELLGIGANAEEQDRIKQQIENLLRDCIDPRLPPLQQRFVSLASGKHILVLRIGQSWAGPHMVKTSAKFFARNSAGKFALDTQQLRAAFAATDDIGRRMGLWRTERIGKILANEAPWALPEGPRLIVHLMPQQSFGGHRGTSGVNVDRQSRPNLPMLLGSGWPCRPNFDGWISPHANAPTYTQIFRDGCMEATDAYTLRNTGSEKQNNVVDSIALEERVTKFVTSGISFLHNHGLQAPVFACVTLTGIKGRRLIQGNRGPQGDPVPQDILVLPEAQIDDLLDRSSNDVSAVLRPVFDVLWQAFGYDRSMNYNANGRWTGDCI